MLCPCHSKKLFEQCCQPLLNGFKKADTPEQLMRSRYSAYATQKANYIYNTYSKQSQKQQTLDDIQAWASQCKWINLIIHHTELTSLKNSQEHLQGIVEFSAYFIEDKTLCLMREKSYFQQEDGQWRYHTGEMIEQQVFKKIKRNEPCPCQQGKKFKQCCAPYLN